MLSPLAGLLNGKPFIAGINEEEIMLPERFRVITPIDPPHSDLKGSGMRIIYVSPLVAR